MRALVPEALDELVLLGAHCDDIAIGAGGTVLTLCRARPGLRVRVLVLSGGGPRARPRSARPSRPSAPAPPPRSPSSTCPTAGSRRTGSARRRRSEAFRRTCDPDLVLAPSRHDDHQDHRGLALLVPTVFRDHLALGYEILKAEPDLAQPPLLWPLDEAVVAEKSRLLHQHYPSQTARAWFDDATFAGLARIRGVQCGHRYAEGFHPTRMVLGAPSSP